MNASGPAMLDTSVPKSSSFGPGQFLDKGSVGSSYCCWHSCSIVPVSISGGASPHNTPISPKTQNVNDLRQTAFPKLLLRLNAYKQVLEYGPLGLRQCREFWGRDDIEPFNFVNDEPQEMKRLPRPGFGGCREKVRKCIFVENSLITGFTNQRSDFDCLTDEVR